MYNRGYAWVWNQCFHGFISGYIDVRRDDYRLTARNSKHGWTYCFRCDPSHREPDDCPVDFHLAGNVYDGICTWYFDERDWQINRRIDSRDCHDAPYHRRWRCFQTSAD